MNLPNCLSYQKKKKSREFRDLGPFFKILLMIVYKIREKLPVFFIFKNSAWNDKNRTDSFYLVSALSSNPCNTNSIDV